MAYYVGCALFQKRIAFRVIFFFDIVRQIIGTAPIISRNLSCLFTFFANEKISKKAKESFQGEIIKDSEICIQSRNIIKQNGSESYENPIWY